MLHAKAQLLNATTRNTLMYIFYFSMYIQRLNHLLLSDIFRTFLD